jgi:hypothetical protein
MVGLRVRSTQLFEKELNSGVWAIRVAYLIPREVVFGVRCQRNSRRCSAIYLFNDPRFRLISYNSRLPLTILASRLKLDYFSHPIGFLLSFLDIPTTVATYTVFQIFGGRTIDGSLGVSTLRFGHILCISTKPLRRFAVEWRYARN